MARTPLQTAYVNLLRARTSPLVIATGCAGTGKTHLAVVEGASALLRSDVQRLVLVRPAISAGENLGYLPGTCDHKMEPFMRPMLDALNTVFSKSEIAALRKDGRLEVAPIAYMRGRTFSRAWIVLDEAQNTTPAQLCMALTRIGLGTKMVVTGDLDQVDLPSGASGLADLLHRMCAWAEPPQLIAHVRLGEADVQRADVVKEVLSLYGRVARSPVLETTR